MLHYCYFYLFELLGYYIICVLFGWSLLGFEGYLGNGILQWYQSIDLAQPVELAIYDTGGKALHLLQR